MFCAQASPSTHGRVSTQRRWFRRVSLPLTQWTALPAVRKSQSSLLPVCPTMRSVFVWPLACSLTEPISLCLSAGPSPSVRLLAHIFLSGGPSPYVHPHLPLSICWPISLCPSAGLPPSDCWPISLCLLAHLPLSVCWPISLCLLAHLLPLSLCSSAVHLPDSLASSCRSVICFLFGCVHLICTCRINTRELNSSQELSFFVWSSTNCFPCMLILHECSGPRSASHCHL